MPSASVSGPDDQIVFHHAGGPVQDGDKLVSYPGGEEGIHAFLPREVALNEGPECQTFEIGSLIDTVAQRVRNVLTVLDQFA